MTIRTARLQPVIGSRARAARNSAAQLLIPGRRPPHSASAPILVNPSALTCSDRQLSPRQPGLGELEGY